MGLGGVPAFGGSHPSQDICRGSMNSHSSHISDHDTHTLATVDIDGANLLVTQRYRKDYVEKEYEPFTRDLFRLLLKETDTFIDIGAH